MTQIKNVNAMGAVEVPLLSRNVDAGEVVDVTDDQAAVLLAQGANWQPVDASASALVPPPPVATGPDAVANNDDDTVDTAEEGPTA